MSKKRILILTADAGFGHRIAANAVDAVFREHYSDRCESMIINPLEDKRTPFFLRDSQADYDRQVTQLAEFYRLYYDASDQTVTNALFEGALSVLLFETMRDVVRSYLPDAIVTTYPLYQAPLEAIFTLRGEDIPVLTVVTDLATVHRVWFNKAMDSCLVANEIVRDLAYSYGLGPDMVFVTGVPVNPEIIGDTRPAGEIRAELGWMPEITTFLAVGSRRVDRLLDTLNVLNHYGQPIQLAVVAGRDKKLYNELQQIDWHVPVFLYEYVSNVPKLMRAADAVICKAGGLIITEALATGRPILLVDALPGQEVGNAEMVVRSGVGELAVNEREVLETIAHWMGEDGKILKERAANSARLGRPRAAFDVAELAYQASLRGASQRRHFFSRRSLIDLFNRNHVRWGDTRDLKDIDPH
jgi:1,2-diacylglycerol 3-beta-galactosyltransferase